MREGIWGPWEAVSLHHMYFVGHESHDSFSSPLVSDLHHASKLITSVGRLQIQFALAFY